MPFLQGEERGYFHLDAGLVGRSYTGIILNHSIRGIIHAVLMPNGMMQLGRPYEDNRIGMIWKFNSFGRIYSISTELEKENKTIELINVGSIDKWDRKMAKINNIPHELDIVGRGFSANSEAGKYYNLLLYGHKFARRLKESIEKKELGGIRDYLKRQMPLPKMIEDEDAHRALERITSVHPEVVKQV